MWKSDILSRKESVGIILENYVVKRVCLQKTTTFAKCKASEPMVFLTEFFIIKEERKHGEACA